jgi:hypothetical protein
MDKNEKHSDYDKETDVQDIKPTGQKGKTVLAPEVEKVVFDHEISPDFTVRVVLPKSKRTLEDIKRDRQARLDPHSALLGSGSRSDLTDEQKSQRLTQLREEMKRSR